MSQSTREPGARDAYILAVQWPAALARELDALREAYFPPERNYLDAHLTLFHALPGAHLDDVQATLTREAAAIAPCALRFVGPYSLGAGVALRVRSPALEALRARLARAFAGFLTRQDQQTFRAHVTVQNKVSIGEARRTLQALEMAWNPDYVGEATGLSLHRYAGGPWDHVADFPFAATAEVASPRGFEPLSPP